MTREREIIVHPKATMVDLDTTTATAEKHSGRIRIGNATSLVATDEYAICNETDTVYREASLGYKVIGGIFDFYFFYGRPRLPFCTNIPSLLVALLLCPTRTSTRKALVRVSASPPDHSTVNRGLSLI